MVFLRKLHVLSALFLIVPFTLYAVSGLLLNHPTVATETERSDHEAERWNGTALDETFDPEAAAEALMKSLRAQVPAEGAGIERVREHPAGLEGQWFLGSDDDTHRYSLAIDAQSLTGRMVRMPKPAAPPRPDFLPTSTPPVPASAPTLDAEALKGLAEAGGAGLQSVRLWEAPRLSFVVRAEGREWKLSQDLASGRISARPLRPSGAQESWRERLVELHRLHGYPPEGAMRWAWGLLIDLTGLAMLLWALSGLCLWWSSGRLRGLGLALLAIGAAGSLVVLLSLAR